MPKGRHNVILICLRAIRTWTAKPNVRILHQVSWLLRLIYKGYSYSNGWFNLVLPFRRCYEFFCFLCSYIFSQSTSTSDLKDKSLAKTLRLGLLELTRNSVEKRGLQVMVAEIPKTIDDDIAIYYYDGNFGKSSCDKSQWWSTKGQGGLFEFIEERLKENGHMVIVVAERAGQDYVAQEMQANEEKDASGNRLLLDVGLWLSDKIKDHFTKILKMLINMKYIDIWTYVWVR